jgi:hypothetical protein
MNLGFWAGLARAFRAGLTAGAADRAGGSRLAVPWRQRVTFPALMQDVHTCSRLGVPLTVACTTWMLGFQRRGVRRCEWETLLPKPGPLPQMSQTAATGSLR